MKKWMNQIKTAFLLGFRNIWREKKRSIIIFSSAGVGAFGIITMFAFFNGILESMLTSSIQSGLGYVQIRPEGYLQKRKTGMLMENPKDILTLLRKSNLEKKGIYFAPRFEREGFLRLDNRLQGINILGIEVEEEKKISYFEKWKMQGDFFKTKHADEGIIPACYIGKANAEKFELSLNDTIVLSIANEKGEASSVRVRVAGIYQSPVEPIDKYTVLVKRQALSKLYAEGKDAVSSITLSGVNLELAKTLKLEVREIVAVKKVEVLSYQDLEPGLTRMLDMSDTSMFVFSLILMVGFGLILFDTVLISVMERTFEIGILRAIGTSNLVIFSMIIFESVLLSFFGISLGILFGAAIIEVFLKNGLSLAIFSKGLELMGKTGSTIYPALTLGNYFMTLSLGFAVSIFAGLYPSWKAVRIRPVEALANKK